jgi:hypothetical protein
MIKSGRKFHFTIAAQNQNFRKKPSKTLLTPIVAQKLKFQVGGGLKFLANFSEGGNGVVGNVLLIFNEPFYFGRVCSLFFDLIVDTMNY